MGSTRFASSEISTFACTHSRRCAVLYCGGGVDETSGIPKSVQSTPENPTATVIEHVFSRSFGGFYSWKWLERNRRWVFEDLKVAGYGPRGGSSKWYRFRDLEVAGYGARDSAMREDRCSRCRLSLAIKGDGAA
uniref:Uncharacterized protein n=1 Tax=Fagus sylvatica TaxID=28930 RepID=A0A2N9HUJ1_FAGSY